MKEKKKEMKGTFGKKRWIGLKGELLNTYLEGDVALLNYGYLVQKLSDAGEGYAKGRNRLSNPSAEIPSPTSPPSVRTYS